MSRWPSVVIIAPPEGAPGDIRVKFNAKTPHVSLAMALAFVVDLFTKNGYTYNSATTGGKFGILYLVFTKTFVPQFAMTQTPMIAQPQFQQQIGPNPSFTQNTQLHPVYSSAVQVQQTPYIPQ